MDNTRKNQNKEDKELESRSCASNGTAHSEDLIPGLRNEITIAHIISRLPWYVIPYLRTLNSTWGSALKNLNYANYFRCYQSGVLVNSFVFYTKNASNRSHNLQIYQDGVVRRLPFPHNIPPQSRPEILVTYHCIYCLTLRNDNQNVYNVYTLDLGRGIIEWQSLSPLPNRGNYLFADRNTNSIWMRKYNDIPTEENKWSWSAWMHTITGNNIFSEWQRIPADPPRDVRTNFLDIQAGDDQRHIYGRLLPVASLSDCSILNICEPEHNYPPEVLLVFEEDYDGIEGVVSKVGRMCWRGDRQHGNGNFTVMLNKIKLQHVEAAAAVEGRDDLNAFQHWWRNHLNHKIKTYTLEKQGVGEETCFSCEGNDLVFNKFFRLAGQDTVCLYCRMVSAYPPVRRFQNRNRECVRKFLNRNREYMRGARGAEVSLNDILSSVRRKFLIAEG